MQWTLARRSLLLVAALTAGGAACTSVEEPRSTAPSAPQQAPSSQAPADAPRAPIDPPQQPPPVALDHLLIATPQGASAERAALEAAGFRVAPTINRHEGQGTASATVEFENGFLELIWPDDGVPARGSAAVAKERFAERADWRNSGHAPFCVGLRRTPTTPAEFPFETWKVGAEWMQPGTFMEMLTPRGSPAVNLAVHPGGVDEAANLRAIEAGGARAEPFLHPNGARRLTRASITAPDADGLPPSAAYVNDSGAVRLAVGDEWLLELVLDEEAQGASADLRPVIPLLIRY
jgi:hypothetical protein